jgi:hypothetical protein
MAGHQVTLVSRAERAGQLNAGGAVIQDVTSSRTWTEQLPVLERLPAGLAADMCLVTVRREQIESVLPDLAQATAIPRIVFLVNHAHGSQELLTVLGRSRVVLAFPGVAGCREDNTVRYLDIPQQHTAVEQGAHDVVSLFRGAGFPVDAVTDRRRDGYGRMAAAPCRIHHSHGRGTLRERRRCTLPCAEPQNASLLRRGRARRMGSTRPQAAEARTFRSTSHYVLGSPVAGRQILEPSSRL